MVMGKEISGEDGMVFGDAMKIKYINLIWEVCTEQNAWQTFKKYFNDQQLPI